MYFSRTDLGERLGMMTLAPASTPRARPSSRAVPRAVVEGSSTSGRARRHRLSKKRVVSGLPGFSPRKGVSLWGRKGPRPIIWGRKAVRNCISSASISGVCPGVPTMHPQPVW